MASAGVPPSPASSKRSRSRGSLSTPRTTSAAATPVLTPAGSAHSLVLDADHPLYPPEATPFPAFLRPVRADVDAKWSRLEAKHAQRLRDSTLAAATDQPSPWARCSGDAFAARNRYANVDPYQATRMRLDVPDGHSDYINASPIRLAATRSRTTLAYIATQGPRADSWAHLWRMIWHEHPAEAVVVMLTQTHEAGREKCFPYYPDQLESPPLRVNEHDEFHDGFVHDLHLRSFTHDTDARTDIREIDMTTPWGADTRKVWHLLFAGWPDFSVPEGPDRAAMLKLVDISRAKNTDNPSSPRIVHCSAGIGRSGTFIALDWLLQELEEGALDATPESEDPVITVVQRLRDQRAGMVQSKSQLLLIYDLLRERWRERWIAQHPSEASRLGISSAAATGQSEPALKRQKSVQAGDAVVAGAASRTDTLAELEAELMDADMAYEKGKT